MTTTTRESDGRITPIYWQAVTADNVGKVWRSIKRQQKAEDRRDFAAFSAAFELVEAGWRSVDAILDEVGLYNSIANLHESNIAQMIELAEAIVEQ